ncbi:hypothetical protein WISP_24712 [Willisornis vidua]|uniref:Uncharacterized protein n=1 Tax=Willisornis vidua TaxID=1566151 RepID=A0ABQ9DRI7_9PASS|nr:hypothetical protein WISP_24712 [Willisornis vidua]
MEHKNVGMVGSENQEKQQDQNAAHGGSWRYQHQPDGPVDGPTKPKPPNPEVQQLGKELQPCKAACRSLEPRECDSMCQAGRWHLVALAQLGSLGEERQKAK